MNKLKLLVRTIQYSFWMALSRLTDKPMVVKNQGWCSISRYRKFQTSFGDEYRCWRYSYTLTCLRHSNKCCWVGDSRFAPLAMAKYDLGYDLKVTGLTSKELKNV